MSILMWIRRQSTGMLKWRHLKTKVKGGELKPSKSEIGTGSVNIRLANSNFWNFRAGVSQHLQAESIHSINLLRSLLTLTCGPKRTFCCKLRTWYYCADTLISAKANYILSGTVKKCFEVIIQHILPPCSCTHTAGSSSLRLAGRALTDTGSRRRVRTQPCHLPLPRHKMERVCSVLQVGDGKLHSDYSTNRQIPGGYTDGPK